MLTSFLLLATNESFTSFHPPPPHTLSSSSGQSPRGSISYHRRAMTSDDGCDDDRISHGPFPELVVFDLDACFWDREMLHIIHNPDRVEYRNGRFKWPWYGRGKRHVGTI